MTLDPDVAVLLEQARESTKRSLKEIVNDALRRGLAPPDRGPEKAPRYETPAAGLGGCLIPDLDDVAGALSWAEGDDFR